MDPSGPIRTHQDPSGHIRISQDPSGPSACNNYHILTNTAITAAASFSEKNRCANILSNNSPPFINSITIYTQLPSS